MEPLKRFSTFILKKPVVSLKYILVATGFFVTFTNLFDCIVEGSPPIDYVLYVGVIGIGTILLVFIESNIYLCFILALFGVIAIFDSDHSVMSGGIVFLLFSKRIANNLLFSALLYVVTFLVVAGNAIYTEAQPGDVVNLTIVYFAVYFIDFLLYNIRRT